MKFLTSLMLDTALILAGPCASKPARYYKTHPAPGYYLRPHIKRLTVREMRIRDKKRNKLITKAREQKFKNRLG